MSNLILTPENYHSPEANLAYFSASQLKSFQDCEARTMAELRGEWQREETPSMLVGSYVDAHFSRTLDLFKAQHPDIYTRTGTLRSEYLKANDIIARLERDDLAMMMLNSMNQVIVTGTLCGQPFRGMLDMLLDANLCDAISKFYPKMDGLLFQSSAIVDLKVMRDFQPIYKEGMGRVTFVEAWGYDLSMAIYQRLILERDGTTPPCYILGATKETVPDIGLFSIRQSELDAAFEIGMENIDRYAEVKAGKIEPTRCEECDWCKTTKTLTVATVLGDF
jgi:hypothetical protein